MADLGWVVTHVAWTPKIFADDNTAENQGIIDMNFEKLNIEIFEAERCSFSPA